MMVTMRPFVATVQLQATSVVVVHPQQALVPVALDPVHRRPPAVPFLLRFQFQPHHSTSSHRRHRPNRRYPSARRRVPNNNTPRCPSRLSMARRQRAHIMPNITGTMDLAVVMQAVQQTRACTVATWACRLQMLTHTPVVPIRAVNRWVGWPLLPRSTRSTHSIGLHNLRSLRAIMPEDEDINNE